MPALQVEIDATVISVRLDDESLRVILADGREIITPMVRFPSLLNATPEQRKGWHLIGRGVGIGWRNLDEHISVAGLLRNR
jgi:hypothetical protein